LINHYTLNIRWFGTETNIFNELFSCPGNFFLRETVVVAPNNADINVFPLNGIMSNTDMKISIFANIFSINGITIKVVIADNVHA